MNAGTGLTGNELYPRFSDAEYDRRYHAVREAMLQNNLDAILVSGTRGSSEVHYLSNYLAQSPCWLLFPREGAPTVFIHFFNSSTKIGFPFECAHDIPPSVYNGSS